MEELVKNLGFILVIIGAIILILHYALGLGNAMLIAGFAIEIVGIIAHVVINKLKK